MVVNDNGMGSHTHGHDCANDGKSAIIAQCEAADGRQTVDKDTGGPSPKRIVPRGSLCITLPKILLH